MPEVESYEEFLERVTSTVARFTLRGPLPTWFEVKPDGAESAAIIRAKMARICSRAPGDPHVDPAFITTTSREVIRYQPNVSTEAIETTLYEFARSIYDHEFHEWFRRDGVLVDDPHAEGRQPA